MLGELAFKDYKALQSAELHMFEMYSKAFEEYERLLVLQNMGESERGELPF